VSAIALADGGGPDYGVLTPSGVYLAKTGVSNTWTTEASGIAQIALADGPDGATLGMLDGAGGFYVKSSGLSAAWQRVYASAATSPNPRAPPPPPTQITQTTPLPKAPGAIHARFKVRLHYGPRATVVRYIRLLSGLPARGRVTIRCAGPHCPRIRATAAGRRRVAKMLARLAGRRFAPGDRVLITVAAPGHRPERIELRIRRGRKPVGRLLSS
jgi:hypothetical protein